MSAKPSFPRFSAKAQAALGWALALAAVVGGWLSYGGPGVALALTVIVFWLLLQFSRALRVMRQAAGAPVGYVDSAVMLHAKLRRGMRLMDIIPLTRSLGQVAQREGAGVPAATEIFTWTDGAGVAVRVELVAGRLRHWDLQRPGPSPGPPLTGPGLAAAQGAAAPEAAWQRSDA
jgi:hypothetical protein